MTGFLVQPDPFTRTGKYDTAGGLQLGGPRADLTYLVNGHCS